MLESNTSRRLIDRPNLAVAKIVTGVAFVSLFFSTFLSLLIHYLSIEAIQVINIFSSLFLLAAYFYLSEYLKNFDGTKMLRHLFYIFIVFSVIQMLANLLASRELYSKLSGMAVFIQVGVICVSVLSGFIALKLIAFKNDFVGGLKTVGYLLLGASFLTIASTLAFCGLLVMMQQEYQILDSPIYALMSSLSVLNNLMIAALLVYLIVVYINAEKYNEMIKM